MAGRIPPTGFYAYRPASGNSRSLNPPPPPPPPPPPSAAQGTSSAFAYSYSYDSSSRFSPAPTFLASQQGLSTNEPSSENQETKNSSWTCDACELTLDSERALKSHRKSHVKCTACSFEGVPKVVKGHYQAIHGKFSGSGFKTVTVAIRGCRAQRFRICVGSSPEDIQQWIADRKKRFPRQQKAEEAVSSACLDDKKELAGVKEKVQEEVGISSLLLGYGSSSGSDDNSENEKEKTAEMKKEKTVQASAPTQSDTAKPSATSDQSFSGKTTQPRRSRLCRYFARNGSCLNGDACSFSHDPSSVQQFRDRPRKRKRGQPTSKDTLLRKLLANDMERETSLALQLLGYIADSNFFDDENTESSEKKEGESVLQGKV